MKKQSIVIFEDWIRYSRCLTDGEFRQLINLILDYYKGIEPTGLKGNLALVWNDIIDDLNGNLNKLKAKREVVANNRKKKTNTKKVASEGGNWFAMVADIDRGLRRLTQEQLTIMYLRFGDGCDNTTLAKELDITEDAARMRVNRAMNNLLNYIGGARPRKERDYTEEEMNERATQGDDNSGDIHELGDEVSGQDVD